jgi:hypothetical protein
MTEAIRRLRAQKFYSTDPEYLERMARREEARTASPAADVADDTQVAVAPTSNPGAHSR